MKKKKTTPARKSRGFNLGFILLRNILYVNFYFIFLLLFLTSESIFGSPKQPPVMHIYWFNTLEMFTTFVTSPDFDWYNCWAGSQARIWTRAPNALWLWRAARKDFPSLPARNGASCSFTTHRWEGWIDKDSRSYCPTCFSSYCLLLWIRTEYESGTF